MTAGERIKNLREAAGLTQEELGKMIGTTKQTVFKYENGIVTNIPSDKIELIAGICHVSPAFIMGWSDSSDVTDARPINIKKQVPVLGRVAAGMPIAAIQNIEYYENVEDERIDYALRVKGDSMIGARICDGDTVYVTKDTDYENGDIVIALINGDDATVKRFYKYPDQVILRPENPTMKERHFKPGEVQLLGKVIEIKIKL